MPRVTVTRRTHFSAGHRLHRAKRGPASPFGRLRSIPRAGHPSSISGFGQAPHDDMDQTPAIDPTAPEPIPDHAARGAREMDQTRS